ncbi:hypothetical protein K2P47_02015 [Patescibacteria group bacterium]|nr:hypothetical protein [Patescibacteria group bacterium]
MNLVAKVINFAFEFPVRFLVYFFITFTTLYGIGTYAFYKLSSTEALSSISILLLLGIIAGILQVVGYLIYILHEDIDPNPVTWFMFAYGTAILTILEWDTDATFPELILPSVCAVFAIIVSYRCWVRARKNDPTNWWPEDWWPNDKYDKFSFVSDIVITIGYVSIWFLILFGNLEIETKETFVVLFLFLSNLSTFPAFYPILRTTYNSDYTEAASPWFIWALAYALLGIVTFITHDALWHPLMFYPLSNAFLHALVGIFALRAKRGINHNSKNVHATI